MEQTTWKQIPNLEGKYLINELGEVKRLEYFRENKIGRYLMKERIHKCWKCYNGYFYLDIKFNNIRYRWLLHRLLATLFIPNPLNLEQINHINFDRKDNRLENLEWVTRKYNMLHAQLNPTRKMLLGEKASSAKLTNNQIAEIITLYKTGGFTYKGLAEIFYVSDRSIGGIITGKNWNSVSGIPQKIKYNRRKSKNIIL